LVDDVNCNWEWLGSGVGDGERWGLGLGSEDPGALFVLIEPISSIITDSSFVVSGGWRNCFVFWDQMSFSTTQ